MPWEPDGSGKVDFTGLALEAEQFQFPDGTVLGEGGGMSTTINITIDRVIIDKAIFKADDCKDDEDEEEPEEEPTP